MTIFSINNITKLLGKKHTAFISREEHKVWEKTSFESVFQISINEKDFDNLESDTKILSK